jgi:hypothetical protein
MKIWTDRTVFQICIGKLLMRGAWEIDEFMDGRAAGHVGSVASAKRHLQQGWKYPFK